MTFLSTLRWKGCLDKLLVDTSQVTAAYIAPLRENPWILTFVVKPKIEVYAAFDSYEDAIEAIKEVEAILKPDKTPS